ncbi:Metallo-hydrolase/oxidoreductase [Armillaria luteobubalina]|uniref:Metallo-hydrolase/oxidoreductase n=1 Tax=Armillaria luteobubalina TaxID=153913 RepID=A0AA39PZB5_9AGAR|nr:Metallo-hydrolase/oxidoreductase [Armillaria luteobubalina]
MPALPSELPRFVKTPTWGMEEEHQGAIKATWLGHACFLVEVPFVPSLGRGTRVLDTLSHRARFRQYQRRTQSSFSIIIMTNNHTLSMLFKGTRAPHIFAPLGNKKHFESIGVPRGHAHTLDWWDAQRVEVPGTSFNLTCTPAQHFTGRGLHDQGKTLLPSWAVEGEGKKVYFAGDTGYGSVKDGEDEAERPVCPAFKEIRERFGGFDLAMIPIGAYEPRLFMSTIHCAPQDSVHIFKDIRAKKAVAIHWGTWILTTEEVTEPPKRLTEECKKIDIDEGDFLMSDIGKTK